MLAVVFSRGVLSIPHIEALLDCELVFHTELGDRQPDVVFGWGNKANTVKARAFAQERQIPFCALEDGFVRSYGLGVNKVPPMSLVVDGSGIYYDATRPSDVELALNSDSMLPQEVMDDARAAIAMMLEHGVSKYSYAPDMLQAHVLRTQGPSRRVLVIDQTMGDLSVQYSGGTAQTFEDMLQAAIVENRDAQVWVKVHPDVMAGKKRGYLLGLAHKYNIPILDKDFNPFSVLKLFDRVYTVSSQMGFEALLMGKRVTCFGVPFYAGWGCTDDRMVCDRRKSSRSVTEIFAVAYLMYARYLNPATNKAGSIFDLLDHLIRMRRREEKLSGRVFVLGVKRWKRALVLPFLKTMTNQVVFVSGINQAKMWDIRRTDKVVTWGHVQYAGAEHLSQTTGCKHIVMEDGFIRSVGLGSDFVAPASLCIDASDGGIYFAAGRPSSLEFMLNDDEVFTPRLLARAKLLRERIVELGLTKYNVDPAVAYVPPKRTPSQRVIFVPGQVENDASVRSSLGDVTGNIELLRLVRKDNPDAFIIYKPHPDVVASNRIGGVKVSKLLELCDVVEVEASSVSLISVCDEVHCISSLVGFDALLRGKKVVCYGTPFYAGWGLTVDRVAECALSRRQAKRTIDELVVAALILYPTYVHPQTSRVCEVELVVDWIHRQMTEFPAKSPSSRGLMGRVVHQMARLVRFVRLGL